MSDQDEEPDYVRRADGTVHEIDWGDQDEIVLSVWDMAERLRMPAEHLVEVERRKDELGGFYYTEIGVLVIVSPEGGVLARIV